MNLSERVRAVIQDEIGYYEEIYPATQGMVDAVTSRVLAALNETEEEQIKAHYAEIGRLWR